MYWSINIVARLLALNSVPLFAGEKFTHIQYYICENIQLHRDYVLSNTILKYTHITASKRTY